MRPIRVNRLLDVMDKLNKWLTLLANIGVLFGIGFLAYEIRQNTVATHAQTRESILSATQTELEAIREDPNLIHSIIKEERLTADEQIKLYVWLVSALRIREFSWLQWKSGIIDEAQWETELAVTVAILQAPRVRLWWSTLGHKTVSEDFSAFVNVQIMDIPASNGIYEEQTKWAND
jgi:hypothetical protein